MTASKTIQNLKYKVSSLFMLLALAWLTISLPFVYADQQAQKAAVEKQQNPKASDDNNSLTNTTEEKSENGVNTLSEYLHEVHHTEHLSTQIIQFHKCHSADVYLAFHPDLISPPPDTNAS